MRRRAVLQGMGAVLAMAVAGKAQGNGAASEVFELRVYHTFPGKLEGLLARFRDHTMTIFQRHGMESVAYWVPTDEPLAGRTLYYILRHPSRAEADVNWAAFRADPDWKQVSAASEANGKLVERVESTFLVRTDFSPRVGGVG